MSHAEALAGLGETTQEELSESDSYSVPCHTFLADQQQRAQRNEGFGFEPRPCTELIPRGSAPVKADPEGTQHSGISMLMGELSICALNSLDTMEVPPGA